MKIACFWAEARSLDRISFRHEHLIDGFAALGHEATLVTARDLAGRFSGPSRLVDRLDELSDAVFWRASGFELAVGLTWLGKTPVLEALVAAGIARIAIADSDGQLGCAAHPRAAWAPLAARATSWRERLRAARLFARRYLESRARREPGERAAVASVRLSNSVAFAGAPAIAAFHRFLASQGATELAGRAFAAPFPVPASFREGTLPPKEDLVVAVGRWDDPQKDAPLLASALEALLRSRPSTRVVIAGGAAAASFGALAAREPRLELAGVLEPPALRETVARARVLALASRWETGPHAAFEALALGATIVSTPLPTVEGAVDGDRFGALAHRAEAGELARALAGELDRWDSGERDAAAIAEHWRERLSPVAYCRSLLAAAAAAGGT
jgi:glycosyltransferase involved in cell wall biosynthesis